MFYKCVIMYTCYKVNFISVIVYKCYKPLYISKSHEIHMCVISDYKCVIGDYRCFISVL